MLPFPTNTSNQRASVLPVQRTRENSDLPFSTVSQVFDPKWSTQANANSMIAEENPLDRDKSDKATARNYEGFPLIQSMIFSETKRTQALEKEGTKQREYPKSDAGWMRTVFVFEGRAFGQYIIPWAICTLAAAVYLIIFRLTDLEDRLISSDLMQLKDYLGSTLELTFTMTMSFLLVFRLSRSAVRFWMARSCWGAIMVKSRGMVGTILLHGSHDPHHRDQAIRWIAAFSIATMNHLRDLSGSINPDTLAGILDAEDFEDLNTSGYPPLYAADKIRFHLAELLGPDDDSEPENNHGNTSSTARSIERSYFRTQQLISLEQQLNRLIDEEGAMQRIKGTPLPLVYVAHLRTWLMVYLLAVPFFRIASLSYAIVPVEFLAGFALLGLEGAAAEVESPFRRDRTNHLDMNTFCLVVLSNILQQAKDDAHRRIDAKRFKKT